jgi:hypothetical protein
MTKGNKKMKASSTLVTFKIDNNNVNVSLEAIRKLCATISTSTEPDREQFFSDVLGDEEFIAFIAETLRGFTPYDLQHCWNHKCMKAKSTGGK